MIISWPSGMRVYFEMIIATTHVHLDHHNCLEVILLRGTVGKIRDIGDALASFKGVKPSKPYAIGGDGFGAVELVAESRIGSHGGNHSNRSDV